MKIDIAMVVTQSILSYARFSIALNTEYAVHHGYGFHLFTAPSDERDPTWGKIEMAQRLLPGCDWLFVMDADAVFVDLTRKLEWLCQSEGDILACENGPNGGRTLNCGTMMLRNSAEVLDFLGLWYRAGAKYAFKAYHEQESLNDYFEKVPMEYRGVRILPFPFDAFNSHWLDHEEKKWKDRFVVHMMRCPPETRARFFREMLKMSYCAVEASEPTP